MNDFWLLFGLFASGFTSATILPGNSELAFGAILKTQPPPFFWALAAVSSGNILGGMTTVLLGRLAPPPRSGGVWMLRLQRFGTPVLLLTPLPLVGDVIAAAAGWLRLSLPWVFFWSAIGRVTRYSLILFLLK